NANGTCVILVSGDGLSTQRLAKVDLQVSWSGADGRIRTRATTTLISNGGISRMNLPAFGAAASGTASTTTTTTTTSGSSGTSSSGTTTTTTTSGNNGNGNGRGNVGGKSGKN